MKKLKDIFAKAGMYCMAMTVIYAIILHFADRSEYASITLRQYCSVVLFSVLLAAAGLLWTLEIMPKAARLSLHYLVCTASFLVVFVAFGNIQINNPSQILFLFFGFSLLYALLQGGKALVSFCFSRFLSEEEKDKKKKADATYTPLYK